MEQRGDSGTARDATLYYAERSNTPREMFQCSIGMRWTKRKMEMGAAWILKDSGGLVVLHSRRSFTGIRSKDEACYLCQYRLYTSARSAFAPGPSIFQ